MNPTNDFDSLRDRLLERFAQGDHLPSQLAAEVGCNLAALSTWILDPRNLRLVQGVALLADVQTQMLISRYRASAAVQLIKIATAADPTELSRKACVDVLATDLEVFDAESDPPAEPPGASPTRPTAPDEQMIIAALERLAREADERNEDGYVPPTMPPDKPVVSDPS